MINQFPYSNGDVADALRGGDFLLARSGHIKKSQGPCVQLMAERELTLVDIARTYVNAERDDPAGPALSRALTSTDFGNDLVTGLTAVVTNQFNAQANGFMGLMKPFNVPDFKPNRIPALSIGDFANQPEASSFKVLSFNSAVIDAKSIETHGGVLVISRQSIINDAVGAMVALMAEIANQATLDVAKSLAAAIEDTANLDDGAAFFNDNAKNRLNISGAAPSITSFDSAAALLMKQLTPAGGICGAIPRFFVSPAEWHATSNTLNSAIFGDPAGQLTLKSDCVTLPHLTSTTQWYLVSDPNFIPALGYLTLGGAPALTVERVKIPHSIDSIGIRARTDFRIVRLQRLGIVKVY